MCHYGTKYIMVVNNLMADLGSGIWISVLLLGGASTTDNSMWNLYTFLFGLPGLALICTEMGFDGSVTLW